MRHRGNLAICNLEYVSIIHSHFPILADSISRTSISRRDAKSSRTSIPPAFTSYKPHRDAMDELDDVSVLDSVDRIIDHQFVYSRSFDNPPIIHIFIRVARDLLLMGRSTTIGIPAITLIGYHLKSDIF